MFKSHQEQDLFVPIRLDKAYPLDPQPRVMLHNMNPCLRQQWGIQAALKLQLCTIELDLRRRRNDHHVSFVQLLHEQMNHDGRRFVGKLDEK